MKLRILCVDDEISILAMLQAALGYQFDVITAAGSGEALAILKEKGPFAVIISDMKMPAMSGIEFLTQARKVTPDTVRMLFTGHAELKTAIAAVNDGHIFRFLTKPSPVETLLQAVQAGVEQYRLLTAEKELLEKTLHGSIKVLTDVLAAVNPIAFGRAARVQQLVKTIADALGLDNTWQFEVAALLSQIGCVTMPEAVLTKVYTEEDLNEQEQRALQANARISHGLLAHIPRLEGVAESIACCEHRFDGAGSPETVKRGVELPLGARLLKAALDLDSLELRDYSRGQAVQLLKARSGWYDPAILDALESLPDDASRFTTDFLRFIEMRPRMILAQNVHTNTGILLVSKHQEITGALLHRLLSYSASNMVNEPIKVLVPIS